jgi:hypothetical protein
MTEFKNRLAVAETEKQVLLIGWFFRPQDVSDQGIDAHVEKVDLVQVAERVDEVGTGRLIALQIKGGASYFADPSPNGWWFSFSGRKAKLWLEHALPVVVVLVDIENDVIYWQRISSRTIQSTGKNFKVEVPRSQTVTSANDEWTHIASGLELQAEARYDYALRQLPPGVRQALESRDASERSDAALLAYHLAEGRGNARGTVESLLVTSPVWITRNGPWPWRVIASYAAEHEHYDLSADAFERAARASITVDGMLLAAAALNAMQSDKERSMGLIEEAAGTGVAGLLVAVGRALLTHPEGDAGPRNVPIELLAETADIRRSSVVQSFLTDQALRAGDIDAAFRHSRMMLDADQENTRVMRQRAEVLLRRWNTTSGPADDLPEAISLLTRAISQRREWGGPTVALVADLARTVLLDGQFDRVLELTLLAPEGSASPEEATDPGLLRLALIASNFLGRRTLVNKLAAELDDSVSDRILRMRVGVLSPSRDEARELWNVELQRAVDAEDFPQIASAAISLAHLGTDVRPLVADYIARSIMPPSLNELIGALLLARSDFDAALPTLRELSRTDMVAAEHMISMLRSAGRDLEAAKDCEILYAFGDNPLFLVQQAGCLIDANDDDAAEPIAIEAINATAGHPIERAKLLTFLGARAGSRGDWGLAERRLTEVVRLFANPTPESVWRVIIAQLNQGKLGRAARTLDRYRPEIRTKEEAELWLEAASTLRWDEAKASQALSLARRFKDPRLSTALLGRIVNATYGEDGRSSEDDDLEGLGRRVRMAQVSVPATLHHEAFAALQELVDEFGEDTGIRVMRGDPDVLVGDVKDLLQDAATVDRSFDDLLNAARNATVPLGFLAGLRGNSYALMLLQRAMGVLIASSADDEEHAQEVITARRSWGQSVVVDAAAMLTISGLGPTMGLSGRFQSLRAPANSIRDVHRAGFEIRGLAASPGSMRWDSESGVIIFEALSEVEYVRQLRRAQVLEDFAEGLPTGSITGLSLLPDIPEASHSPWTNPLQLAHDEGLALWSDDLGLRRLARSLGVSAFGTPSLVDAVRDRALEAALSPEDDQVAIDAAVRANRSLAADLCVDLPLGVEDIASLAEDDDWVPRAGGAVLSRPAWWAWQEDPIEALIELYGRIPRSMPEVLPDWQKAAMFGLAKALPGVDGATKALALVALLGYGRTEGRDEDIVDGVRRARLAASELRLPDPVDQLPAAAAELARLGKAAHPEELIERIMSAVDVGSVQIQ